ncbi:GNAT family N-acetyltransferase [filamentous cyanobacterium LEGE 11480]|uniref:GNAT family N-acetyltransferase n=2 Tax=Romeriopsis TaxID=2992131 RepID=A0A928Z4C6_9CYAN|nr:GNAT family N-acetyltransferase [Romeriopsis navalis LEGE 11480]
MSYHDRPLTKNDASIVWEMLMYAAHEQSIGSVKQNSELTLYAEDWGRAGDLGFGAFDGERAIGAGWIRLWSGEEKGYGYIADDIPELALAVAPDYRGQGIGTQILQQILDSAKTTYPAISLSVREDNPVIQMYERLGFQHVDGSDKLNRVGTRSFNMLKEFR